MHTMRVSIDCVQGHNMRRRAGFSSAAGPPRRGAGIAATGAHEHVSPCTCMQVELWPPTRVYISTRVSARDLERKRDSNMQHYFKDLL